MRELPFRKRSDDVERRRFVSVYALAHGVVGRGGVERWGSQRWADHYARLTRGVRNDSCR